MIKVSNFLQICKKHGRKQALELSHWVPSTSTSLPPRKQALELSRLVLGGAKLPPWRMQDRHRGGGQNMPKSELSIARPVEKVRSPLVETGVAAGLHRLQALVP